MTILAIFLLAAPPVIALLKASRVERINLHTAIRQFNRAFVLQLIFAIIFAISAMYLNKQLYQHGGETLFSDVWMELSYSYVIIGFFIYLPVLFLLNLLNYIIKLKRTVTK